ncbi:hypothetical protein AKJ09_03516 [Labilithrix luteola]|uniref:Putative zinc-finger domain-containing protein n=1 Tax=Labilithrix luteola TaxID=1391654 RepID=A0A0K1PTL0_9BACT|nr:zf-HC2 domain-containing protein [Labilithrix luteola]AKU96852.1 hypothetical protein AKJ09_03516 [Labilithrix luteola]
MSSPSEGCKSTAHLLGAHLDGQLDAVKTLEVEDHLSACEVCRERLALDRALRGSLKKAVKTATPQDVRARMLAAMTAETAREVGRLEENEAEEARSSLALDRPLNQGSPAKPGRGMLRHWRTMLPLASAAALALAWGSASKQPVTLGSTGLTSAGFGNDELLREFVAQHSRPLPPEQTDPKQVRQLERYVGVPVHVQQFAPFSQNQNARFVGGRVVPVHGSERAAMLQYELSQGSNVQRVTVFVYNPRNVQVGGAHLAPRAIGTAEVRVGQTDGYSVVVREQGGVGYTYASDLDPETSAKMVAAAASD